MNEPTVFPGIRVPRHHVAGRPVSRLALENPRPSTETVCAFQALQQGFAASAKGSCGCHVSRPRDRT
eukprot:6019702-Prymnesium_polylepis.3